MEYRYLGRTGIQVSPVCLGSDDFGDGTPPEVAEKLILRSLDAGINLIDTGNLYAGGRSEAIIGKTLAASGRRHEVLISTKIDHAPRKPGVSLDEHVPDLPPNVQGNSRLNIIRACELSLKALKTDWIDLLQVHRYYPQYHIEETLGALTDLVRQGKVRYAGCSTFPAWKLMHALMLSEMKGYVRFVNEESPYNLLDRRIENELVPLAREHGVGLLTWSPLAHGMLTGAYADAATFPKRTRAGSRGAFYAARVTAEGIRDRPGVRRPRPGSRPQPRPARGTLVQGPAGGNRASHRGGQPRPSRRPAPGHGDVPRRLAPGGLRRPRPARNPRREFLQHLRLDEDLDRLTPPRHPRPGRTNRSPRLFGLPERSATCRQRAPRPDPPSSLGFGFAAREGCARNLYRLLHAPAQQFELLLRQHTGCGRGADLPIEQRSGGRERNVLVTDPHGFDLVLVRIHQGCIFPRLVTEPDLPIGATTLAALPG